MREETRLWLEQARSDLKFASENLRIGAYYVCAFLAAQAAEKALKALHIESRRELAPRTHNLLELGRAVEAPKETMSALREINPDYTVTRYPDAANGLPSEAFDQVIAADHLEKATGVFLWAEKSIKSYSNS